MDTSRILGELRAERDRLDKAISALEAVNSTANRRSRHRRLSAATRARMAAAQRARWAKAKQGAVKRGRRMSRAARNKIAAAQRARWAKTRAQRQVQMKAA